MKFEDLDVWKRAARLSANIYKEIARIKDFGFKDQITRSGLSIPSYIHPETGKQWIKETRELSAMLVGLIRSKQNI